MTRVSVPAGLDAQRALGPDWATWLDGLAITTDAVLDEWALTVDGPSMHGYCSLVLPVATADGEPAALKLTMPDDLESQHEALALERWAGHGAVRLLRSDRARRAMLLERLGPADVATAGEIEACEIIGSLYGRLHVEAPPSLVPVAEYVARWADGLARAADDGPIPPAARDRAVGLARDLLGDRHDRLIHGDFHQHNVLAGTREPWLAIDPKAMAGDPHYEPAPLFYNEWEAVLASDDPAARMRRRLDAVVGAAGLDPARAAAWVYVRLVINANWSVGDAERAGRGLNAEERDWIALCLLIASAVEDRTRR